ncbi:hypothetical protein L1987_83703 [Smallanthus sonchifolius]|uniref:Uncharacterized protein n=1 Tax=Smallanthus sonchifolius TaxID=185202 RepID=A0ACB8YDL3_9ASTR|nr:hypothetical protein L1987_83703 [Smallanthus sonchifolius]
MKTDASVFKRLGRRNQENIARNHQVKSAVCKYWLQGKCTRNPCRYLHPDQAKPDTFKSEYVWKNPNGYKSKNSQPKIKDKENCDQKQKIVQKTEQSEVKAGQSKSMELTKTGFKDEKCHDLQTLFGVKGLSMVARLEGHSKDVTGIAFPSGSSYLFSCSNDKSLRVWDCNSGQCGDVINFDDECATLVEEGPWIFAGLKDMIKAWNLETQTAVTIRANGGMVNAITMFEDILFAGMEDGTILSWKSTSKTSFSEEATSLKGHKGSVLSLIIGAKKLFSGSTDHTIRVWDIESLECKHVLNGHTGDVTSVICWDQYLLSGSLDKTIKVWGATESGSIEEVYKHDVDDGVVAFCGIHDAVEKPILLCSCKDNGVCLYDLPLFAERGRILSKDDIKAIQVSTEGLFFTGDAAGSVSVWKLNGETVS